MRVFKTKIFKRWAKGLLTDASLLNAVDELVAGKYDASLGKKVFKQRIALSGVGKSGGTRVIVVYHEGDNVFFMYGFEKNERANISDTEKRAFQKMAKYYLSMKSKEVGIAIKANELVEVKKSRGVKQ